MSRFPTHGSVELDVEENILLVQGCGPWNLESVVEAETNMAPLLEILSASPVSYTHLTLPTNREV